MDRPLTVVFDGDCALCARLVASVGGVGGIETAPILSETGAHLLRDLSPAARSASVHVVDAAGRRLSAGAALPVLARLLPSGRILAALLSAFPRVTERGYRLVASHRMALSAFARRAGVQRPDAC